MAGKLGVMNATIEILQLHKEFQEMRGQWRVDEDVCVDLHLGWCPHRLQLEMVVYLSELRTAKVLVNSLLLKEHLSEPFYILHCSCHSNSIIFL